MGEERELFNRELAKVWYHYGVLSAGTEVLPLFLHNAVKQAQGVEEPKFFRYMLDEHGNQVVWFPETPIRSVLADLPATQGYLYGLTQTRMIAALDGYLTDVLAGRYGRSVTSGSAWTTFVKLTGIDLRACDHDGRIFLALQERHKIEHARGRVDATFLSRTAQEGVAHVYKEGDAIKRSHLELIELLNRLIEFVACVDAQLTKAGPERPAPKPIADGDAEGQ